MGGGFTRPSVHQRSEALKELCDGLGVLNVHYQVFTDDLDAAQAQKES